MIGFSKSGVIPTTGLALLEIYNPFLAAFAILSLATNVLATFLIAYKAWCASIITPSARSNADHGNHLKQGTQADSDEVLLRSRHQIASLEGPRVAR